MEKGTSSIASRQVPPLEIRLWKETDAEALSLSVARNLEHLRPWMPWIGNEPLTTVERRTLIQGWESAARRKQEYLFGIFVAKKVIGSCGLHGRIGPNVWEIGYWVDQDWVGRGVATETARILTDWAFQDEHIERVEIHHNHRNERSARIPSKLGFQMVRIDLESEIPPGGDGSANIWVMTRSEWAKRVNVHQVPRPF